MIWLANKQNICGSHYDNMFYKNINYKILVINNNKTSQKNIKEIWKVIAIDIYFESPRPLSKTKRLISASAYILYILCNVQIWFKRYDETNGVLSR